MKKYFLRIVVFLSLLTVLLAWVADWQWSTMVYKARTIVSVISQPADLTGAAEREQQRQERLALIKTEQQYEPVQQSLIEPNGETAQRLQGFIEHHPSFVQPYLDLASYYAKAGQLADARLTLIEALQADTQSALLFTNLQKVQGAMAANAYKAALDEDADLVTSLDLPSAIEVEPAKAATQ